MLIASFIRALETVVPLSAIGYARDAVGLQVGLPAGTELTAALFAYEVTPDVIAEARERGANLIVAFHPLIFPTIDSITDANRTGHLVHQLIKNDIALYIQHTAFDTHPEFGTSHLMAEQLALENIRVLATLAINPAFGMGAIGTLAAPMRSDELVTRVSEIFHSPCIRFSHGGPEQISRIAMVGGAGMEFYSAALREGADAFITADARYHDFHRAAYDNILLIDAGHAETESFVTNGMIGAAKKALGIAEKTPESKDDAHNAVNLHGVLDARLLLLAQTKPNAVRYGINPVT